MGAVLTTLLVVTILSPAITSSEAQAKKISYGTKLEKFRSLLLERNPYTYEWQSGVPTVKYFEVSTVEVRDKHQNIYLVENIKLKDDDGYTLIAFRRARKIRGPADPEEGKITKVEKTLYDPSHVKKHMPLEGDVFKSSYLVPRDYEVEEVTEEAYLIQEEDLKKRILFMGKQITLDPGPSEVNGAGIEVAKDPDVLLGNSFVKTLLDQYYDLYRVTEVAYEGTPIHGVLEKIDEETGLVEEKLYRYKLNLDFFDAIVITRYFWEDELEQRRENPDIYLKVYQELREDLENYVKNGGGLLLAVDPYNADHSNDNLNPIARRLGFWFGWDLVHYTTYYITEVLYPRYIKEEAGRFRYAYQIEMIPRRFIRFAGPHIIYFRTYNAQEPEHPILRGVGGVLIPSASSVHIRDEERVKPLFQGDEWVQARPPVIAEWEEWVYHMGDKPPTVVVGEIGDGRVIGIGDSSILNVDANRKTEFLYFDNRWFTVNMIKWLAGDL